MRFRIHTRCLTVLTVLVLSGLSATSARADEVTDWTQIMLKALTTANPAATVASRDAAIVEASMFDAVNGVKGHYTPVHVTPAAPKGTSDRAAAVQAAYATLSKLFPAQQSTFDAARAASLNAIANVNGGDNLQGRLQASVDKGVAWGQQVADAIWAWRLTDGFTSPPAPFLGGTAIGEWRPTPPAFAAGALPQFATMTPWVIASPSQFRPAGPPALDSALYAQVYNETKAMGSATNSLRTADQTQLALFWQSSTATYFWSAVGLRLAATQDMTLLEDAHLFAALNIAIADSVIAAWDAKYHFVFWRPVTAIQLGDSDPNLNTAGDPNWTPLIATPNHPEYPSAHSSFSSAGAAVLAQFFGANTPFVVDSDKMPGATRSFSSFDAALQELADARVLGGIHFRTACDDGKKLGTAVGNYVVQNAFLPGNGNGSFEDDDN
jgi:membrane-associated phospholipid phosphatase